MRDIQNAIPEREAREIISKLTGWLYVRSQGETHLFRDTWTGEDIEVEESCFSTLEAVITYLMNRRYLEGHADGAREKVREMKKVMGMA